MYSFALFGYWNQHAVKSAVVKGAISLAVTWARPERMEHCIPQPPSSKVSFGSHGSQWWEVLYGSKASQRNSSSSSGFWKIKPLQIELWNIPFKTTIYFFMMGILNQIALDKWCSAWHGALFYSKWKPSIFFAPGNTHVWGTWKKLNIIYWDHCNVPKSQKWSYEERGVQQLSPCSCPSSWRSWRIRPSWSGWQSSPHCRFPVHTTPATACPSRLVWSETFH